MPPGPLAVPCAEGGLAVNTGEAERIDRLEQRLAREKAARRESEEVAERSLQRLYHRQRVLDVLTRTAALANAETDADAAFLTVMRMIIDEFDFTVGHLLAAAHDDPQVLVSTGLWVGQPGDDLLVAARAAAVGVRYGPGMGVPGRVMVHGPRWEDLDPELLPERAGRGAVFAVGVMVRDILVAVLEFMSPLPKQRDPELMAAAVPMGEQLGRVIERKRAREQEQRHRLELEETVQQRTRDLLKAHDRAEALAQARTALFNTVTHELSTPLHAAMAALDTHDPDTARRQLATLQGRLDAMLAIAADLSGASTQTPMLCMLDGLLTQICEGQRALAAERGGDVSLTVDPSAAEEVLVDAPRLRGALETLIAGMRLAQPEARMTLRGHLTGRQAAITLLSSGPQPDLSTTHVAQSLLHEAGGHVTTRPDGFEVTIPVARPRLRRTGRNRRILLVDDTQVTQQLASAMLADAGLEVDTAHDGEHALQRLRGTEYGTVLMDIRMPVLDGLTAMRRVRDGELGTAVCDVPIVAMTADSAPGSAERGLLSGFDAYLTKPFTKEAILTVVGQFLPED